MTATWMVDPVTREPLAAFEAHERELRAVCGNAEWPGEHEEPGWERSTVDDCGFQYVRRCRRPCCHPPEPDA